MRPLPAVSGRSPAHYFPDAEARGFLFIVLVVDHHHPDMGSNIRYGTFQVVSMIISTGFTTSDYSSWPLILAMLLVRLSPAFWRR